MSSSRLELPGLGVLEDRWDRIIVDTIAELNAFVPEPSVPCPQAYCKEDGLTYVHNGTVWGIG